MTNDDLVMQIAQREARQGGGRIDHHQTTMVIEALAALNYTFEPHGRGNPGRFCDSDEPKHGMAMNLSRKTGLHIRAIYVVLSRLQGSGLVSVERIGNQKHYRANHESPIFEELQSLVVKTVGLSEPIRKMLEPHSDKIKTAFVYGSVAKGTDTARSDVDLMVIGDELDYSELYAALQNAETQLRRKVSPTFLSSADWRRKVAQKGSFASKVSSLPKIFIFGSEGDLKT